MRPSVVLCVDDEQVLLRLLTAALTRRGYVVLTATTGRQALDVSAASHLDAVILDFGMPEMDGAQAAAALKAVKPSVPIILFSGAVDFPAKSPVDAIVRKGEGLDALLTVLARLTGSEPGSVRRFPRYRVNLPFAVLADRAGKLTMFTGVSHSISEGGVGGTVQGPLLPGEKVLVQLADPQLGMALEPRAQVCYRSKDEYGFQFLNVTPPEQEHVRRFCQRLAVG